MAKSTFTCADCGAPVVVTGRNRSEADRSAAWHEAQGHRCDACQRRAFDAENAAAAAANMAAGLPELSGSEKQVAWAQTLRAKILAELEAALPYVLGTADLSAVPASVERFRLTHTVDQFGQVTRGPLGVAMAEVLVRVVKQQTKASWWIDHRDSTVSTIARSVADEIRAEVMPPAAAPVDEQQAAAEEEALLLPAGEPESALVVEVRHQAPQLVAILPERNEAFREQMHALGFKWDSRRWVKQLGATNGDPIDRLAEVAHRLVAAGFRVRLFDEDARRRAIAGSFTPEHTRWVGKMVGGDFSGWLRITWQRPDDLYAVARSLPGSRYKSGAVYVPAVAVEAVAEFAERHDFRLTPGAQEVLEQQRAALARGAVIAEIKASPDPIRVEYSDVPRTLAPVLADIDDELRD